MIKKYKVFTTLSIPILRILKFKYTLMAMRSEVFPDPYIVRFEIPELNMKYDAVNPNYEGTLKKYLRENIEGFLIGTTIIDIENKHFTELEIEEIETGKPVEEEED